MKLHPLLTLLAVAALGAGGYALYALGVQHGAAAPAAASVPVNESGEDATRRHIAAGLKAGDVDPANGRKILYYHDPMVPASRFEQPAKSPFMEMMMSPVYADGGGDDAGRVAISPRLQQSLGVRTAPVLRGALPRQLEAVGSIAWNERDQVLVQARAAATVERLHVRAVLDRVARGQPLLDLVVPEWAAGQEELLALRRANRAELLPLLDAARQRLRLAGMSDSQIEAVERSGIASARVTLAAPAAGVVAELGAREGMAVMPGTTLLRINGTARVWAQAEVPESQAGWLRPGSAVRVSLPALPGASFDARVQALLPEVAPATRTTKVRVELDNRDGRLAAGMFVQMRFANTSGEPRLLVPSEAVIQTGRRSVVLLAEEGGRFRPVEVEAGDEAGEQTEIRSGLSEGERVVVSSQFLIDSEASLRGVEARLNAPLQGEPR